MYRVQRSLAARAAISLAVTVTLSYLAWSAGRVAMLIFLAALLLLASFAALSLAPDAIAYWRGHHWRWAWRSTGGGPFNGPFWAGTREPRRPYPPLLPARGAAAPIPDDRDD